MNDNKTANRKRGGEKSDNSEEQVRFQGEKEEKGHGGENQNNARGIEEIFSLSCGLYLEIRGLSLINSSYEELEEVRISHEKIFCAWLC